MRFIDQATGIAFNPTSDIWPEKACVTERFVTLRISKKGDHVVAEEPKLYWKHDTFVEAASSGESLKSLLGRAINGITCPDEHSGNLKYATWFSEKYHCIFQFAYSELEADIYSWDPTFKFGTWEFRCFLLFYKSPYRQIVLSYI